MVHPASGYSIVNSLSKAGEIADHILEGLGKEDGSRATQAWESLWSSESRRKMAFYQFGAEMISKMPLETLREFMRTFYALPAPLWKGFLSHRLSSPMLIPLAVMMFFLGNNDLKKALVSELASPAGIKMYQAATAPLHTAEGQAPAAEAVSRQTPPQEPLKEVFRREQLGMGARMPSGFVDDS
uniref:Uncharacterized protein n=1 Tax=Lotharella oceanica TaxID=641309 RepID=A0A7S2TTC1_9EUKA